MTRSLEGGDRAVTSGPEALAADPDDNGEPRATEDDMDDAANESSGSNGHDPTTGDTAGNVSDETFAWTAGESETSSGGSDPRAAAERMLGQLQSMIDAVATQAAPVVRQIGAKAAELAAVAADRAGPLAHKAADATADASVRLAERSRTWAADLRSRAELGEGGEPTGASGVGLAHDPESDSSASAALDGPHDPTTDDARDDPAEGAPD